MKLTTVIMTSQMDADKQRVSRNVPTSRLQLNKEQENHFSGLGTRGPRHAVSKTQRLGKQQLVMQSLATACVALHEDEGCSDGNEQIMTPVNIGQPKFV